MSYWTEWSANHMSYNDLGQPSDWKNEYYPLLPTTFRSDNFPSSVSGPFDFKFNWLDK